MAVTHHSDCDAGDDAKCPRNVAACVRKYSGSKRRAQFTKSKIHWANWKRLRCARRGRGRERERVDFIESFKRRCEMAGSGTIVPQVHMCSRWYCRRLLGAGRKSIANKNSKINLIEFQSIESNRRRCAKTNFKIENIFTGHRPNHSHSVVCVSACFFNASARLRD